MQTISVQISKLLEVFKQINIEMDLFMVQLSIEQKKCEFLDSLDKKLKEKGIKATEFLKPISNDVTYYFWSLFFRDLPAIVFKEFIEIFVYFCKNLEDMELS